MCGRFRNNRALPPLLSEKLLQCSFWRFVDTQPIVRPRFRMHFADILNSQLMYTVQLLIIKGGLTLILSFPKAWFFFCGFAVQISVASSIALFRSLKVALLVFPARNSIWDLCRTICKCELYCLSKRSRHFIDQKAITFHTLWDLISLHRKKRPKVHFALFLKTKISTNEAHVSSSFTASFHPFSLKFGKNDGRVGELLFLASFASNEHLSKGNTCFIKP